MLFQTLDEHDPLLVTIAFECRMWLLLTNLNPEGECKQLRSTIGRKTLRLVKRICRHQHQRGRYFLVEIPVGSLAWRYHGILLKTLEELGGKYVLCDQCAFGLKDLDTGRLICKTTGWLSNCEPLLNHIGKRCRCKPGTHQCLVPTQVVFGVVKRLTQLHFAELFAKVFNMPWSWTPDHPGPCHSTTAPFCSSGHHWSSCTRGKVVWHSQH